MDSASVPGSPDPALTALLRVQGLPDHLVDVLLDGAVSEAQWAVQSAVLTDHRVGDLPSAWVEQELQVLEAVERLKAWADSRGLAALRRLHEAVAEGCRHLDDDHVAMGGRGLTRRELRHEGHAAAVDEVVLAMGLPEADVVRRLELALDDDGRGRVLVAALRSGEVGLDRALRIHRETQGISPEETRAICTRLLSRNADGSRRTHRAFSRELRRQVALHRPDLPQARADAVAQRTAYGTLDHHGTGTFVVTGEGGRVAAAMDRVDDLARRLRAEGDRRTLTQLRSDVALDLLLYGWATPTAGPGESGRTFVGQAPPARVTLVLSLVTALGLPDEDGGAAGVAELPGYGYVGAAQARQLAMASGSVWRRLVTDPATGAALDVTTHRYRPTAAMAATVAALDGVCRAPGCPTPAHRCDIDHGRPWPRGSTAVANLSAKHRRHHNHKTRGTWTATSDGDGTILWTTASRRTYVTQRHRYDDPWSRPVTETEIVTAERADPPPPF